MHKKVLILALVVFKGLNGCASVSSTSAPIISQDAWTTEPIYLTKASVPSDLNYQVIGQVKANARSGYDSVETLYPLLVQEARKVGANAIIGVEGGRAPSAFSWAAPFTSGTAIKIDNVKKLEKYEGQYYK